MRAATAFDHPDFLYEWKVDGFRALAHVTGHRCTLVSRNGHTFKSWPQLAEEIAHAIRARNAVIDGEICCLRHDGSSDFRSLMFRREWPHFYAFDVLSLNGEDLRSLPLIERKRRLRRVMPTIDCRLLYLDAVAERGGELFRLACARDLEGIVAKWAHGTYQSDGRGTSWLKIKNPTYTQIVGRADFFDGRGPRSTAARRPDLRLI